MNTAHEIQYVFLKTTGEQIILRTHQTKESAGVVATMEITMNGVKSTTIEGPVRRSGLPVLESDLLAFAVNNNYTLEKYDDGTTKSILNTQS